MVPGNFPIGCSVAYLTQFKTSNSKDYDPNTGCIIWLNDFARHHNLLLQSELDRIRKENPHANIIYADYYNAAMDFYRTPHEYGRLIINSIKLNLLPTGPPARTGQWLHTPFPINYLNVWACTCTKFFLLILSNNSNIDCS